MSFENSLSLFELIILIGITQGIVTGTLLLKTKKNPKSSRFLGLAILAFCWLSTKMLLHTSHLWDTNFFRYFPNSAELVIAPLMFFYVVSLIDPRFRFNTKHFFHFIPFIIFQSYAFLIYFSVIDEVDLSRKDFIAGALFFDQVKKLEDYLAFVSIVAYLTWGHTKLRSYQKWLSDTVSDDTYPDFHWLDRIFKLSSVLGLFLLFNLMLDSFDFNSMNFLRWQIHFVFIAILIYYFGFMGYVQPHFALVGTGNLAASRRYTKLSPEKITEIREALEKALVTNKAFLNPTLKAQQLADDLGIGRDALSYVVNHSYQKSFRDLINDYRIEEVKSLFQKREHLKKSILGVALECGFNSEASFYRIFKKQTSMTPTEYVAAFSGP